MNLSVHHSSLPPSESSSHQSLFLSSWYFCGQHHLALYSEVKYWLMPKNGVQRRKISYFLNCFNSLPWLDVTFKCNLKRSFWPRARSELVHLLNSCSPMGPVGTSLCLSGFCMGWVQELAHNLFFLPHFFFFFKFVSGVHLVEHKLCILSTLLNSKKKKHYSKKKWFYSVMGALSVLVNKVENIFLLYSLLFATVVFKMYL